MNEPGPSQEPSAAPGAPTCKWDLYPDGHRCPRPRAPRQGTRGPRLRDYCEQADAPGEPVHNPGNHWRALQKLPDAAQGDRASDAARSAPTMTTARLTGTELLQSAGAYTDRLEAIVAGLRGALASATDPAAAETEIERIRGAADELVEAAAQRAREAEQRAADAAKFAEVANAAAEQMSEDLDAAQTAAAAAGTAREEADQRAVTAREEADQQVSAAREEADQQVAAIRQETASEVEQARAGAADLVRAAQDERAQAVRAAAQAGEAASQAQQAAAVAAAEAKAAREELSRYRADVDKMLDRLRTDTEREREQILAGWQARAQRDADEIERLRRELDQLRAAASGDNASGGTGPSASRRRSRARRAPAATERDQA